MRWQRCIMVQSANFRGAALMVGSMTCFTINDTFIKLLGAELPFFQILSLRSLAALLILGFVAYRTGALFYRLSGKDRRLILVRSLAEMAAAYFFLTALINMEIANATAILQALPLTVSLAAALFLGETVGWRRFVAIGLGFVGVMLIVRPGTEGFTVYSLYALAAVVCITVRDLAARRLSEDVPTLLVATASALAISVLGLLGGVGVDWQPMSGVHMVWLASSVGMILLAYLFSVMTMRVGDVGFVAPFRYTSLLVAMVLGLIVFGDWPDGLTMLGAGIVVATGLFTLWRERKQAG